MEHKPYYRMSTTNHVMSATEEACWWDNKACLFAQVPSLDEMKKEVANITCQMQSVYFEDGPSPLSRPLTQRFTSNRCVTAYANNDQTGEALPANEGRRIVHTLGRAFGQPLEESNYDDKTLLLRSNTIDKMDRISTRLVEGASSLTFTNSRLPHEEQISEVFDVNGRRFRQTYKRRVSLERKLTKEVFLLPANSMNGCCEPTGTKVSEIVSLPSLQSEQSNHGNSTSVSTQKPVLDLSVVHYPPRPDLECLCITPSVVLQTVSRYPEDRSMNSSKPPPSLQLQTIRRLSDDMNAEYTSFDHYFKTDTTNNNATLSKIINTSRRHSLWDAVDSVRKRFKRHRRIRGSFGWKIQGSNNQQLISSLLHDSREETPMLAGHLPKDKDMERRLSNRSEIFGYMYQFGVWDAQSPVLDPRLLIRDETAGRTWTVKAACPEWHHAEVGLDSSIETSGAREPLVRGRIVACLQRFTHHNPTSGQMLHRSTYVQQTRLFRQRDKHASTRDTDNFTIKAICDSSGFDENPKNGATPGHLGPLDETGFTNAFPLSGKNLERCATKCKFVELLDSTKQSLNARCSSERLQILQSICPSAAAAVTLLGHPLTEHRISISDLDLDEEGVEPTSSSLNFSPVTAATWCPPAFVNRNPSPFLLFQQGYEEMKQSSKQSKVKMLTDVPKLLIRGGTLEGLLAYALHSLNQRNSALQWDNLFYHVFCVTHPTFTTSERLIDKLIQFYISWAPVEPGCLSTDWNEALMAANVLTTVVKELNPEQLTTPLALRLARFARLLIMDGLAFTTNLLDTEHTAQNHPADNVISGLEPYCTNHKALADRLFERLTIVPTFAQLHERILPAVNTVAGRARRRSGPERIESVKPQETSCRRLDAQLLPDLRKKTPNTFGIVSPNKNTSNKESTNFIEALRRTVQFIRCDSQLLAKEITRMEEALFSQINFNELLDIHRLERGESPTLSRCVEHFNRTTRWARSLLFVLSPALDQTLSSISIICSTETDGHENMQHNQENSTPFSLDQDIDDDGHRDSDRSCFYDKDQDIYPAVTSRNTKKAPSDDQTAVDLNARCSTMTGTYASKKKATRMQHIHNLNVMFGKLCDILKHLKVLKNFSSLLALLLAVQQVPEYLLTKRSKALVSKFSSYMKPPMFTEYRRELETSSLPYLPYLGLIFQQLIHLHAGNSVYLTQEGKEAGMVEPSDDVDQNATKHSDCTRSNHPPEKIVNVWRCWKHYQILGYFLKRKENPENLHDIPCIEEVRSIVNGFCDTFPDALIEKAKEHLLRGVKMKRK